MDDTRSGYGLRGSGGGTISVGGYITNGPSHDRFGRELSNYDRWRMQNGGSFVRDDEPVRYAIVSSFFVGYLHQEMVSKNTELLYESFSTGNGITLGSGRLEILDITRTVLSSVDF